MTTIESKREIVNNSPENVFNFLTDFNNFGSLIPQDKIKDYQCTADSCSFVISGMANIGMKIQEKTPPSYIKIASHGKNPFDFTMDIKLNPAGENKTEAQIIFNGNINPFMKMMVEKPLTNFVNMLVDKLVQLNG